MIIGENGLYFSGSPISIETDNEDTFQTIIKRSASINLVTKDYIGDKLFADNSRNIKVNIYKGDKCIYAGFVEPNTFSQPFVNGLDEFTVNTTDALATLQYYNYGDVNLNNYKASRAKASVKSFKDMLDQIMLDIQDIDIVNGTKGKIFYDLSKGVSKGKEKTIFSDCSMSELYMLGDEADDIWTNEDVISQMMQYFNLHIIQDGFDYYIYDWNTIKDKRTGWYNLTEDTAVTITPTLLEMTADLHSSDDTNLSVADVYNQVSIKCSLEDQDSVIESPMDSENLSSLYNNSSLIIQ